MVFHFYNHGMPKIKIDIPKLDKTIETGGDVTLLELLRHNQVPVAHSCSGDAACGFCRVKIVGGLQNLHPPTEDEKLLIQRKKFPPDQRLACQIWVETDLTIDTDYW